MTTDTKLPHCPMCGHARQEYWAFCNKCHFNATYVEDRGWVAAGPWEPTVRAELARQALEMRAHSIAGGHGAIGLHHQRLITHRTSAMFDYMELGQHPIRLPGEDA